MKLKAPKNKPKAQDFVSNAIIFQVLVTNINDITKLFQTAKDLNFVTKYKVGEEFDPLRGVAYFSNNFTETNKAEVKELLGVCATMLLNQANVPGSIVEET